MKKDKITLEVDPNEIEITAVYLSKNSNQVIFQSVPKHLIYKGRKYVLAANQQQTMGEAHR